MFRILGLGSRRERPESTPSSPPTTNGSHLSAAEPAPINGSSVTITPIRVRADLNQFPTNGQLAEKIAAMRKNYDNFRRSFVRIPDDQPHTTADILQLEKASRVRYDQLSVGAYLEVGLKDEKAAISADEGDFSIICHLSGLKDIEGAEASAFITLLVKRMETLQEFQHGIKPAEISCVVRREPEVLPWYETAEEQAFKGLPDMMNGCCSHAIAELRHLLRQVRMKGVAMNPAGMSISIVCEKFEPGAPLTTLSSTNSLAINQAESMFREPLFSENHPITLAFGKYFGGRSLKTMLAIWSERREQTAGMENLPAVAA